MATPPSQKPLHESTYLTLRSLILSGEIAAGERLVESQLAQKLAVSRTPIREAIRRLQQERLLTTDAWDGMTIVEISLDSALHLYDCRIALEQLAVAGACRHATSEQLQAIERTLLAMAATAESLGSVSPASPDSQSLKRLDLNYEFHRLIAESSQNSWLLSLLDQLANQIKLLRLQTLQAPIDVAAVHTEHCQVFEAICRRDADLAAQQIRQHLEVSQARIMQVFERQKQGAASSPPVICPRCSSHSIRRNGHRQGKQVFCCKDCRRQFLASYAAYQYAPEVRQGCIQMHQAGKGFREIERLTGVNHNTVIRWVNQAQGLLGCPEQ